MSAPFDPVELEAAMWELVELEFAGWDEDGNLMWRETAKAKAERERRR